MFLDLRAAAMVAAIVLLSTAAPAVAADDFAEACTARGKATASRCACQSKLARGVLNAQEKAAMIRAMKGDTDGFRAAISAMGPAPAQGFVAKMKTLQTRTEAECR